MFDLTSHLMKRERLKCPTLLRAQAATAFLLKKAEEHREAMNRRQRRQRRNAARCNVNSGVKFSMLGV